jgi:hypothetical protein|nr:MAG TPA: hypothetical protein [Caudoviricetes sp.]
MEDIIEVGEYIRTKNGKLDKVVNNNYYMEKYIEAEKKLIFCNDIVKHNKQLIDLIEVGDIVKYKLKNLKYTNVTTVRLVRDVRSNKESILIDGYNLEQINILEILTKEQYNINCYKVGGEDEQRDKV